MKKQKDKTGKCIYLRDLLNRGIHFDETSQFETSFFSDVYENAIDAVEEIVNDNRKKEKIVGERRKDQRVRSIANVISFIGRRGTGKSSVMMSFQDALRQYTKIIINVKNIIILYLEKKRTWETFASFL